MASGSRSIGLAKVLTGWTGSLTVTVGATAVGIVPSEPTSAIELAGRIDVVLSALGAQPYGADASAAGVISWRAAGSFTLAASGVIQSRLGRQAMQNPEYAGGASVDYLMYSGYVTLAYLWAFEAEFGGDLMWDLWAGGRYRGRMRIDDVKRSRLGKSAERATLSLSGAAIFERGPT